MKIKGLEFVKTCHACPEQYDVYDEHHNIVGYVRLRWGGITCEYPNVFGEIIYTASVGKDGWAGTFDSEEQRMHHLSAIADKIIEKIKQESMEWNPPTIERRKETCYNCDLFLGGACDGFDEDVKECADFADCWT